MTLKKIKNYFDDALAIQQVVKDAIRFLDPVVGFIPDSVGCDGDHEWYEKPEEFPSMRLKIPDGYALLCASCFELEQKHQKEKITNA